MKNTADLRSHCREPSPAQSYPSVRRFGRGQRTIRVANGEHVGSHRRATERSWRRQRPECSSERDSQWSSPSPSCRPPTRSMRWSGRKAGGGTTSDMITIGASSVTTSPEAAAREHPWKRHIRPIRVVVVGSDLPANDTARRCPGPSSANLPASGLMTFSGESQPPQPIARAAATKSARLHVSSHSVG